MPDHGPACSKQAHKEGQIQNAHTLSLARSVGVTGSLLLITRMLTFISTYPGNISALFLFLERSVQICYSTIQGQEVHRDSVITSETASDTLIHGDLFKWISVGDICVAAS